MTSFDPGASLPDLAVAAADLSVRVESRTGRPPRVFQAPGRINVIGEHTDYSGGWVMPAAIDRRCLVAALPRDDGRLAVEAMDLGEAADLDLAALTPRRDWSDYVAGVADTLQRQGVALSGADLWIESQVPVGAGLSSSAALEVATAHALLALAGRQAAALEVATWCQTAENRFVGMPCGIMDQFASALGVAGRVLALDCGTMRWRAAPLPSRARFLIVDSAVRHSLADGAYAERRADCEAAAARLGVARLGELALDDLPRALPRLTPRQAKRCRHVATETGRVLAAVAALDHGDLGGLGALMNASHASLRDDMEVSVARVDCLVAIAQATEGVFGARQLGGGFGGSVIALVDNMRAEAAEADIRRAYGAVIGVPVSSFLCRAVDGAGELRA